MTLDDDSETRSGTDGFFLVFSTRLFFEGLSGRGSRRGSVSIISKISLKDLLFFRTLRLYRGDWSGDGDYNTIVGLRETVKKPKTQNKQMTGV